MTQMTSAPPVPLVRLVDNDPQLLKAVARLLGAAGLRTQTSTSSQEFLSHYDASVPGCLVLDLSMPEGSGLDLQRSLIERQVDLPIVFLSGHADVAASVRAMKDGALDFLTKPVDADDLLLAVDHALELDRSRRAQLREEQALQDRLATLTPREREVLPYLVSGKLNKQIAAELGVVEKTIKVHRARVMEKLGVHCLADLVRLAARLRVGPTAN